MHHFESHPLGLPRLRRAFVGEIIPCYWRDLMHNYLAVIERDPNTGLFVGFVPGFPGAHSQGATLDELNANLREPLQCGYGKD
jgi:hypothetical protein